MCVAVLVCGRVEDKCDAVGLIAPFPVQIVQHFTELDLRINRARISSDGGWFVDGKLYWKMCWQRNKQA